MRAIMTCLMLVLVLAFAAPPCKSATNDESFIEGAKKEGTLVLYTSMTVDQSQKILDAFRAKYPFIQPKMFRAVGERHLGHKPANTISTWSNRPNRKLTFSKREIYCKNMFRPKPRTFKNPFSTPKAIGQRSTSCQT